MPVALPAQHLEAGDADPRQRLAHEVGDDAEVLGDDAGALLAEECEEPFALPRLRRFVARGEVGPAVAFPDEGAIEADEVIDAKAVVEAGAPPGALAQPFIVVLRHDL